MIVIADTSPLRYLILIDAVDLLPHLFGTVLVPPAVAWELTHPSAPLRVRRWMSSPPPWFQIEAPTTADPTLDVDPGEYEAILLAVERKAPLLVDDRKGRAAAVSRHIRVIGTLIMLFDAGESGLIDFSDAVKRLLETTNFRTSDALIQSLLERDARRKRSTGQ